MKYNRYILLLIFGTVFFVSSCVHQKCLDKNTYNLLNKGSEHNKNNYISCEYSTTIKTADKSYNISLMTMTSLLANKLYSEAVAPSGTIFALAVDDKLLSGLDLRKKQYFHGRADAPSMQQISEIPIDPKELINILRFTPYIPKGMKTITCKGYDVTTTENKTAIIELYPDSKIKRVSYNGKIVFYGSYNTKSGISIPKNIRIEIPKQHLKIKMKGNTNCEAVSPPDNSIFFITRPTKFEDIPLI